MIKKIPYKSFQTVRLILEPTSEKDAPFIFELMNTPKWIKYIGDRNVNSIEEAKEYIINKMQPQLEKLGYSNYTVIRKVDNVKLGSCGLYDREGLNGIDIGFAFLPEHENKGYALEAANKIKKVGFEQFGISQISAITTKDNIDSQKLIEKLGLKFDSIIKLPNDNEALLLYKIRTPLNQKNRTMHFDQQAQDWDNDPKKIERAIIFAKEINDFINPNKSLDALEFGCGTGLLSFELKDFFKTITLADNSEEMINVLQEKIKKGGIKNFKPLLINSLENDLKANEYDVIFTLMTLHHIHDVSNIAKIFNAILKTNGYLCVADLVLEDGSFHAHHHDFDGHNGFDRNELSTILSNNGFRIDYYKICFEIEKKTDAEIKKYPLFLMICQKNND